MARYPWPASSITPDEMRLLYETRESSTPRVPISKLLAAAVRQVYGQVDTLLPAERTEEKMAA